MFSSYGSLCDDFYVDMHVNTELDLPTQRDTILAFFERIGKQFPTMGNFYRRDNGDFCLEEDLHGQKHRWVTLEVDRICSGCANPVDVEDAYSLHRLVLDLSEYMLGVSRLDIDSLDVIFVMDFDYRGNHDEVIAEALFASTAFAGLLDVPGARPIGFAPTVAIALDEDCRTQVRVSVESRTSVYEVRNKKYKEAEPISLYFAVRRYPKPDEKFDAIGSFDAQCVIAQRIMDEKIVPNFVGPLTNAIAQRR
ncbi:MAG: hypothetical protein DRP65_01210 [Planctomycetota bacterium]|nr:MAG: hypothetical protein DRP65_01210 [Planctomycetota bacterium]